MKKVKISENKRIDLIMCVGLKKVEIEAGIDCISRCAVPAANHNTGRHGSCQYRQFHGSGAAGPQGQMHYLRMLLWEEAIHKDPI